MNKIDKVWIEDIWPGYHDNYADEAIISFFNNEKELDRLNKHRNENTTMPVFNLMLIKSLYERNREALN